MKTRFEWNAAKAASNLRKHGLSFETAVRAFADPYALSYPDRVEDHEERWQTIGRVDAKCLVLVAHTINDHDEDASLIEVIRIISARVASKQERRRYEKQESSI